MNFTPLALALGLALTGTAGAVELSPSGQGQALIYPIYSVESGNDTAIHITNGRDEPTIVKVRLLEGGSGKVVHSFNLYMGNRDVWTGVLTRSEAGTRLISRDDSCTLPQLPAEGVELGAGDADLAARSRVGTLEVIEMGGPSFLNASEAVKDELYLLFYGERDCTRFQTAFAEGGIWAQDSTTGLGKPYGLLSGSMTLTNVMNGLQIGLDATALLDFSRQARQTRPEDPLPTLGQSETSEARMRGVVLPFRNGTEAVTALLTHSAADGDYAYGAGLNAETDWVVSFPTKVYLNALTTPDATGERGSPFRTTPDQNGATCEAVDVMYLDRDGKDRHSEKIDLCAITNVIGLGNSNILGGHFVRTELASPGSDTGWLHLSLTEKGIVSEARKRHLSPTQGQPPFSLQGLGMLGFSITRIQNGDVGGLLSNYVSVKRLTSPANN